MEDAKSKNLVYYAFDGIQSDLFMYPRKTINHPEMNNEIMVSESREVEAERRKVSED